MTATTTRLSKREWRPHAMMTSAETVARKIADELIRRAGLPPLITPPWDVPIPRSAAEEAALAMLREFRRASRP